MKEEKPMYKEIFKVRPLSNQNDKFVIVIGKGLASTKIFKTEQEAYNYVKKPTWETIMALFSEMIDIAIEKKTKEKNLKKE